MKFFIKNDQGKEVEINSLYLSINKDDTVIFKVPSNTSIDAKIQAKETLQEAFPNNKIAIINDNIDIGVLRNE